jgi:dipeptidyl aminopeptidase/acylaminoacyl peptidase
MALAMLVPPNRGRAPGSESVPNGPNIQEGEGEAAPIMTFQDLLKSDSDVRLWEHYVTSQPAILHLSFGEQEPEEHEEESKPTRLIEPIGKAAIYADIECSPDMQHLLVTRVVKPYSFQLPASGFASSIEVWDLHGRAEHEVAKLPNEENVPTRGVPVGPRGVTWKPTAGATLFWVEALDGGDTRKDAAERDRLVLHAAPFQSNPTEVLRLKNRFAGIQWLDKGDTALVSESDIKRLWRTTWLADFSRPGIELKTVWSRSQNDRYGDPGAPVTRPIANGQSAVQVYQRFIFLRGSGASPEGERPFIDRLDLTTLKSERIWQCDDKSYESVVSLLGEDASRFITRYETQTTAPNYFVTEANGKRTALTSFPDPTPQVRGITKELVKYRRDDGVDLSFTLYLPADYKKGTKLPTIVWAYPLEFTDAATAGQVAGSPFRFTSVGGASPILLATQGYAVLMDATIPIIGDPETVNDTFVKQLVSSARAAIDKAVDMGVADRSRVGVMGHSYGAFMTANLLAHCDLFRAGVARSGAYNRTLTPFGFQSERRTFWQAKEMYMNVSPFVFADKVNEPLLLIHGMADNNTGTFPIQSERMFAAIKGNGGVVRLVMLPHESHGYAALESLGHVNWETVRWFDKYVKNAK